jgi:hypothetical protein
VETPVSTAHVPHLVAAGLAGQAGMRLRERFPRAPGDGPVLTENYYTRSKDLLDPQWGHRFRRVRRVVFDWPHKLIHSSDGNHELYDLEADPRETANLFNERPEVRGRLEAALQTRLAEGAREGSGDRDLPTLTPEEIEALRSLGYLD